jgi:hypothetical protein
VVAAAAVLACEEEDEEEEEEEAADEGNEKGREIGSRVKFIWPAKQTPRSSAAGVIQVV